MAHVPALDPRSHEKRGNVLGQCLPGCGCAGATRMLGPLRGRGECDIWTSLGLAHSAHGCGNLVPPWLWRMD
jgi:hypothetical protein